MTSASDAVDSAVDVARSPAPLLGPTSTAPCQPMAS